MSVIQTYSGHTFDPLNPAPADIFVEDIAHALSLTCRFNGHCTEFYSVAEHSVWVSKMVDNELALFGLLHDAAEAYVSDVGHPIKNELAEFSKIERDILDAVASTFGLPAEFDKQVEDADLRMLATERAALMAESEHPWPVLDGIQPYDVELACWTPDEARTHFLQRFGMLRAAL